MTHARWTHALAATTDLCRVLGDPTRVRLLALLSAHALTVTQIAVSGEDRLNR